MPGFGKIVTAVVAFILMLPTMLVVWMRDTRKSPDYCKVCHSEPYYTTWADNESFYLANKHAKLGISCQTCHDRTVIESVDELWTHVIGAYALPFEERMIGMEELCFNCHGNYDRVIPLTEIERLGSERNPHAGHWGVLECGECHNMHRVSIDYCYGCHDAVAKEPGWDSTRNLTSE